MKLKFSKMHALGNDFMVVDAVNQDCHLTKEQIQFLGDRRLGVGFDQLLLIETATDNKSDFFYRVYNNDGKEAGQCGNGARCVMRFIHQQGLSDKKQIQLQTCGQPMQAQLLEIDDISVSLGTPIIEDLAKVLCIDGINYTMALICVGNPHAVIKVADVSKIDLASLGPKIEAHFKEGINVSFVQVIDAHHILQRVWERGAGITPACGSAACAAAVAMIELKHCQSQVQCDFPGGQLEVAYQNHEVFLRGPATFVFASEIML